MKAIVLKTKQIVDVEYDDDDLYIATDDSGNCTWLYRSEFEYISLDEKEETDFKTDDFEIPTDEFDTPIDKTEVSNSKYRYCLYTYEDDLKTVYLSNLYVNPDERGKGYGNTALTEIVDYSTYKQYKQIILKVDKTDWVYQWYKRHGFTFYQYDDNDTQYVWLVYYISND